MMRNERLTGFVIHQRAYQEKRALYTFFCQEWGVIDGVAKRGLPLFAEIGLFATGKGDLKTFTQPSLMQAVTLNYAMHYAGLYLNEIIYRLLGKEDECAGLYKAYKTAVSQLQSMDVSNDFLLRRTLRQFELALFEHMGVAIDYQQDAMGNAIDLRLNYLFVMERGFCPIIEQALTKQQQACLISGQSLLLIAKSMREQTPLDEHCVYRLAGIHRQLIDYLLNHKPLHSRKLWQDYERLKQLNR